jgi:hypothetical protein
VKRRLSQFAIRHSPDALSDLTSSNDERKKIKPALFSSLALAKSEWRRANSDNRRLPVTHCTLEWIIWIAAMAVFSALALSGRWTDLGVALVITGVLWYTLVPEYHSGRQ